jgi:pimeloyl-ACP methyl ester carboxylesterase
MKDGTITLNDGRLVAFADYGTPDQIAVLWCHGGPGSRLEAGVCAAAAARAGLRLIGIDRPGYGRSTAQPGRTIGGWAPEALAVIDQSRPFQHRHGDRRRCRGSAGAHRLHQRSFGAMRTTRLTEW